MKWTGKEFWWKHITTDGSDEGTSFPKTASDMVKMQFAQEEAMFSPVAPCDANREDETQKWNQAMVQRLQLEKWTLCIWLQLDERSLGNCVPKMQGSDHALDEMGMLAMNDY